ncbi:MAG TPA: metallophosphoesterase family protein [Thermomicrobiales bacterium]|nr:metallophosphoesterase family protein [Thermomicrobiales bacterium]
MSAEIRIAVFSDVHGNVQALRAVLDEIERRGPYDEIIAAGDYCLKGPEPVAALEIVRERATRMLIGNTDRDIHDGGASLADPSGRKLEAIEWTRERMGPERVNFLGELEFEVTIQAPDGAILQVVHANPRDLTTHIMPDWSAGEVLAIVEGSPADTLVFGHLHIAYTRRVNGLRLFDVAACGLPQDGDRRAAWGEFIWSPEDGWRGAIHRVGYDVAETILHIVRSDMPAQKRRIRDLVTAAYA